MQVVAQEGHVNIAKAVNWIARINRAMTRIVVRASFSIRHCEARRDEAIQIVDTNLGSWIATGINALAMTENQKLPQPPCPFFPSPSSSKGQPADVKNWMKVFALRLL